MLSEPSHVISLAAQGTAHAAAKSGGRILGCCEAVGPNGPDELPDACSSQDPAQSDLLIPQSLHAWQRSVPHVGHILRTINRVGYQGLVQVRCMCSADVQVLDVLRWHALWHASAACGSAMQGVPQRLGCSWCTLRVMQTRPRQDGTSHWIIPQQPRPELQTPSAASAWPPSCNQR